ncbi:DUF6366 family protein [Oceanobacillus iheyensis]|uniref:DUF6366 family protein n=1 Tax=Oceanobacillus iheyensis TaxID=182710 RepID=UPI003644E7B5
MNHDQNQPEKQREKLRQEELKHPASSSQGSNLADLVGGMGWKGTLILLLTLILIAVVVSLV